MKIFSFAILVYKEIKFRIFSNFHDQNLRLELKKNKAEWSSLLNKRKKHSFPQSNDASPDKVKNVLFVTGYGLGTHFQKMEPLVMMALYVRGCKIISLYCNQSLPSCEFNIVGNNRPPAGSRHINGVTKKAINSICSRCSNNVRAIYLDLPIDLVGFNQFLTNQDYLRALDIAKSTPFENFRSWEIDGIAVGEEAFSSILRATFCGEISDTIESRALVERYIYSGILAAWAVERAYKKIRPDRIVLIHGVYLMHGIPSMVARKLGIPLIVMGGGGIRKDTVVACHNETYHRQLVSEDNSIWENYDLSAIERQRVLDYAKSKRHSGAGVDYLNYHPNPIHDFNSITRSLRINKSMPIISVYTNVLWDAQIFYSENVFSNMLGWLFETIDLLGKNPNLWGVIRIHPAEKKGGVPTNQPIINIINKKYKKLPPNIRIVSPESNICSYTLAENSKATIIYGTKMGLEIALTGVPLIVCGESFSRNKGYGIDIKSREEYSKLINNLDTVNIPTVEARERAIRYAHYLYFRKMLDLPLGNFTEKSKSHGEANQFNSLEKLAPGHFPGLDVLCDGIIDLKPLHHS